MLYNDNVQIIQKCITQNIMHIAHDHINPPSYARSLINGLNGEYYGNDHFCLQSLMSEVDSIIIGHHMANHLPDCGL